MNNANTRVIVSNDLERILVVLDHIVDRPEGVLEVENNRKLLLDIRFMIKGSLENLKEIV